MATIDFATLAGQSGSPSGWAGAGRGAHYVEVTVDFAAATTSKGSALAAADVIEVIDIPAKSVVLGAGFEVMSAMTGTSTDLTLDMGITGGDVDAWVDGFDMDAAAVGSMPAMAAGATIPLVFATADTIDILIASQTGTFTGGKVRVWAYILDAKGYTSAPGRAALGS